ncbi:MAG: glycosyltransferase [Elusimicrobiota bacterium]|jgi:glycosyltransferase involved in cell wall biosynthesis|nr:glycosyltransferase [Elusimicrobiota bacterium]
MDCELSIGIPSYSRRKELIEALDSIVNQIDDEIKDKIEICINNDFSPVDPKDIVEQYQNQFPHICIKYQRASKNEGVDMNFYRLIEMSKGKFSWIIGDDDIIEQGGIKYILKEIESNNDMDMYYCNFYAYNGKMQNKVIAPHNLTEGKNKRDNDIVFNSALECIQNIGDLFGYISVFIMNRDILWKYASTKKYIGSVFFTVFYQLSVLKETQNCKYIAVPLVGYRGGNTYFHQEKPWELMKLGTNVNLIVSEMFGENSKEREIIKNFRFYLNVKTFVYHIINAKSFYKSLQFRFHSFFIFFKDYKTDLRFYSFVIPLLLTPRLIIAPLKNIYKRIKG